MYQLETEDVYQDLWKHKDMFDNSDYPKALPYYDESNKKVIGKMKDEAAGTPIVEFVGLRSKMYSYKKEGGKTDKKAKGVKKSVVSKDIKHKKYRDTLFNKERKQHSMNTIRSNKQQLGSYKITKRYQSCSTVRGSNRENGFQSWAFGNRARSL